MFNKGDHSKITYFINGIDWAAEFKDKSVQENNMFFLNQYNQACELFVPKIDITEEKKTKVKWLTQGMKGSMRKRLNFWHANQRTNWSKSGLTQEYKVFKTKMCQ